MFLCLTAAASGKNKLAKLLKSLVRHLQGKSVENIEIQRLEGDILNCQVAYVKLKDVRVAAASFKS